VNLPLNFDKKTTSSKTYDPGEGREQGPYKSDRTYDESTTSGGANVPGTDANGEDGNYMITDGDQTEQTISDSSRDYALNETIENIKQEKPTIQTDISSLVIVVTRYNVYD